MASKKVTAMIHPFYTEACAAFHAGVAAADPAEAVRRSLPEFDRPPTVIAVGKAALSMAAWHDLCWVQCRLLWL